MNTRYAQNTDVAADRSRLEIERTLDKYGATAFAYGWKADRAIIQFEMHGRRLKFILPMPSKTDDDIKYTSGGRYRKGKQIDLVYEQAKRQRWRALLLCIKAKLESVSDGIEQFDEAFMSQILLANGDTVGELMIDRIDANYRTGTMAAFPLLEGPKGV